ALQAEALGLFRQIGDEGAVAWALNELGRTRLAAGDPVAARPPLTESLRIRQGRADRFAVIGSLEAPARLRLQESQAGRAGQLLGAAEGLRQAVGTPLLRLAAEEHERVVAALREALGDERFARHWAEGQILTLEEAIGAALEGDASS